MRFNKLDLNLLVALDVLLVERNVSRSADRLHVTQSAVSNALARLRDYFDDEILVPVGRRMELTPRAELLKEAVRDILVRIESSVTAKPLFEPRTSDRRFRIFVSDYTMITLVPHVLALAGQQAKAVEFELLPQTNLAHRPLERGEADLLIIPSEYASSEHPTEALFDEDFVCVCWDQSAYAGGKLTRRKFLEASHVVMQPTNQALSYEIGDHDPPRRRTENRRPNIQFRGPAVSHRRHGPHCNHPCAPRSARAEIAPHPADASSF